MMLELCKGRLHGDTACYTGARRSDEEDGVSIQISDALEVEDPCGHAEARSPAPCAYSGRGGFGARGVGDPERQRLGSTTRQVTSLHLRDARPRGVGPRCPIRSAFGCLL